MRGTDKLSLIYVIQSETSEIRVVSCSHFEGTKLGRQDEVHHELVIIYNKIE